jgi:glycerate dehydrogenase
MAEENIIKHPTDNSMNICVLDGYTLNPGDLHWNELQSLGQLTVYDRTAPEQTLERCKGADIIFTNKAPIGANIIEACPHLKYIGILATGFNIVDVDAAKSKGIPVCNVPGYSTDSVAQLVLSLILQFSFRVSEHDQRVKRGDWVNSPDFSFTCGPLHELSGKTLGILGLGDIGQAVAKLGQAFGMNIIAHTRSPKNISGISEVPLEELFQNSDVLSLHCPLTPATSGIVHMENLRKMKPSSILINTGRGPLIVESDVATALNEGIIAGAGVDVLSCEPPKADNPMLSAVNCIITPHIAWETVEARQRLMGITVENLKGFLNGAPKNVVNG